VDLGQVRVAVLGGGIDTQLSLSCPTHANAHARTRAHTHTRMHTHVHTNTHTNTNTNTHASTQMHTHARTHTRTHTHTGSFGLAMAAVLGSKEFPVTMLVRKQEAADYFNKHRMSDTYIKGVELPPCVLVPATERECQSQTDTQTHTHTQTRKHTHTHAHTHTRGEKETDGRTDRQTRHR